MLQNEVAVSITLRGGNETTVEGRGIFFENIRDRDGAREGFVEKFLDWKLHNPVGSGNTVFLLTVRTVSSVSQTFLYCGLVICKLHIAMHTLGT